ncbi:hypothetical protein HJG60_011376 [Phyllostomus discolor]|uniref:Uncharacterized protein n=1 Tax=Phyllostomus discolor TaxID=89673 RepID=A0A834A7K6_9CHIR|nr:hypothetical protein HJG60_011376 [Phyllostomus discolor]
MARRRDPGAARPAESFLRGSARDLGPRGARPAAGSQSAAARAPEKSSSLGRRTLTERPAPRAQSSGGGGGGGYSAERAAGAAVRAPPPKAARPSVAARPLLFPTQPARALRSPRRLARSPLPPPRGSGAALATALRTPLGRPAPAPAPTYPREEPHPHPGFWKAGERRRGLPTAPFPLPSHPSSTAGAHRGPSA